MLLRLMIILLILLPLQAQAAAPFRFEDIGGLDAMRAYIESHAPLGTPRETLRQVFVAEGGATLKTHPSAAGTEKYLYDINLCGHYMWVWNISADFDGRDKLAQAYVNGRRVFMSGTVPDSVSETGDVPETLRFINSARRWPAVPGVRKMPYQLFDADGDIHTTGDQWASGAGPAYVDPVRLNEMVVYTRVDPWRSIFDADAPDTIHMYANCPAPAKPRG